MEQLGSQDIVAFLRSTEQQEVEELGLAQVKAGDQILVRTRNTSYLLRMKGPSTAELLTDRPDRPSGAIAVAGCSYGRSHLIKPSHLFCRGNLEFRLESNQQTYTTSPIEGLHWITRSSPA
jgi:hypothetical protein